MSRKNFNKSLVVILLFAIPNVFGQHSAKFNQLKEQYPHAHKVRLQENILVNITIQGDSIVITKEVFEENIYLDDTANYGSKESIQYSSFFEIEELEASSFSYENNKYRKFKVEEFKMKDELNASFYDDSRSINFIYPNVIKGSKTQLKYTKKIKNPRFLNSFYFGDFFPIVQNKVTIIADEEIEIEFLKYNTDAIELLFEQKNKRGKNIYTWVANSIDEYKYENDVPSYANILPHVIPKIVSYTIDGEVKELSKNVSNLYNWYYSLIQDVNTVESDIELVKVVREIVSKHKTDLDKVKALYYWAQQNIKYIAFEYALGGFVPREANDIFKKKYGDCKDNSSILQEMLEIAGLEGQITWIGTRSIPYNYEDVPLPIVDNHMILTYIENETAYFLDATGRYTPFGFPTSFIQGKEALISNGSDGFILKKVPVVPSSENSYQDFSMLTISNNDLLGITKAEISGYKKRNFFLDIERLTTPSETKEYYNAELRKGNNKFIIDSISEKNKYDYDLNFKLDLTFNIKDYVKNIGSQIFVNLNLNKPLYYFKVKENRQNDIDFDFKDQYSFKSTLEIPSGYVVDYVPENMTISNEYLSFEISYLIEENKIRYEHMLSTNFLRLDIAQQKIINDFIKKAERGYNDVVVLKKLNTHDK
jgi:transglutaminase-like putative cysteine protease